MQNAAAPTIEQVISNIVHLVSIVGTVTIVVSMAVTQFLKQFTSNSKATALIAIVAGFLVGITLMRLFNGSFFSPLSLMVAGIAAIGGPGVFSLGRTITTSSK